MSKVKKAVRQMCEVANEFCNYPHGEEVLQFLIENPNTPREYLDRLKLLLASSENIPEEYAKKFVEEDWEEIREKIATNKAVSWEIKKKLIYDTEQSIRFKLALDPDLPPEGVSILVKDEDWGVVDALLIHHTNKLSDEECKYLSNHPENRVRMRFAYRTKSIRWIEELAFDHAKSVRQKVFENPNTPKSLKEKMVEFSK